MPLQTTVQTELVIRGVVLHDLGDFERVPVLALVPHVKCNTSINGVLPTFQPRKLHTREVIYPTPDPTAREKNR